MKQGQQGTGSILDFLMYDCEIPELDAKFYARILSIAGYESSKHLKELLPTYYELSRLGITKLAHRKVILKKLEPTSVVLDDHLDNTRSLLLDDRQYVMRECFQNLTKALNNTDIPRPIIQVFGIRGSGKTTLLIQALRLIGNKYNDPYYVMYLPIHTPHTPCDLLKETINKCIRNGSKYIFIDEIQRVDNWASVLLAFENYDVQFVVAGSQASAFRSNTLLVGRHIDIHVMPYSFKEFKCALEQVPTEKKKNLFSLYLTWGGFPKLLEI
eukprot:TRINITY_DN2553_c0_g1_i2.p1 TRINITY_DN2553_c0_g1~~TRINITY_DN2553_c0_g1_i2.p1  ORF type:complete len:270 (+),score=20.41 TRINITY_DN2553_c0_g1_i2:52-861(+)